MRGQPFDVAIADGTRHLGRVFFSGGAFTATDAQDHFLCTAPTSVEARNAVIAADREHLAAIARLEDDGAPAE